MPPERELLRRLEELVGTPRESLDVELKSWLDPRNEDDRSKIAKALIALTNHGGGYLLLGFDNKTGEEAPNRPADLTAYSTDAVNGTVEKYAEPGFHCDVHNVEAPGTGRRHPVIVAPAGRVPIRAKRGRPNVIQENSYYVRKPGPKSEAAQTGPEWQALVQRCVTAGREELLDRFRAILLGTGETSPVKTDQERLSAWVASSMERWTAIVADLPRGAPARFPLGHYCVGYQFVADLKPLSGNELLTALDLGSVRYTGAPPFAIMTSEQYRPRLQDGCLESWLGQGAHYPEFADFWRVSTRGEFFLIRGYQEDALPGKVEPGEVFDVTLPIWRIGEILLHAQSMASRLGIPDAGVVALVEWTGLSGRRLASVVEGGFPDKRVARQDVYRNFLSIRGDQIGSTLPELLEGFLAPLYELFDLYKLERSRVVSELHKLRSREM